MILLSYPKTCFLLIAEAEIGHNTSLYKRLYNDIRNYITSAQLLKYAKCNNIHTYLLIIMDVVCCETREQLSLVRLI